MSNRHVESHINSPDDLLENSLPTHIGPYRSLSAKRLRDPSNRKSVSFNDVPIVHEVPSHDTMRNSNSDIYRSWTCADATLPYSPSQILLPFNSTSAAAQKIHAQRLSSALYSSTNTLNRLTDWPIRTKTVKSFEETTEHNTNSSPPLIIVHAPSEQINKNPFITQSISSDNNEEKKNVHRSPIIPDNEHYRSLPFTYVPLSESTTTYTSMLTTHLSQPNNQIHNGHTRTIRIRSATLPTNATNSSIRNNDNNNNNNNTISITPLHTTTTNNSLSRTVLKPATIGFHSSTNVSPLIASNSRAPAIPLRSSSFNAHSRLVSSSNRPLSSPNKHTTLSRSRSAHISSSKRNTNSPIVILDGQSIGSKRNSNMRQTPMHSVLSFTNIN
jgi:hypothetical protein